MTREALNTGKKIIEEIENNNRITSFFQETHQQEASIDKLCSFFKNAGNISSHTQKKAIASKLIDFLLKNIKEENNDLEKQLSTL